MLKKLLSAFAACAILMHSFLPAIVFAVTTDGRSTPWTIQKAEHLARKVYFAATEQNVKALYEAGSTEAAVQLVFPDAIGPDRTRFNSEISELTGSGFNWGDGGHVSRLYHFRYARDPYEAKAKLRSLFEDIFSVNQSDQISYRDVLDLHDLLNDNMLGSYKSLVKKVLYNGNKGDYAAGKFLDLLDQSNKNYPNENYARELLQLFLMGEYYPTESKDTGDVRNYEETDVKSLAKILTGFVSDKTTHVVTYDSTKHNTSTGVVFLEGNLKAGTNFLFRDGSGALDLGAMETRVGGNNGLADNTIDYIFAARERAVAGFVADRLFRFYIHNTPTRAQIDQIADTIVRENFEILPVVRSILSSDAMYSEESMNSLTFKNPLELAIGTSKLLHLKSPDAIDPMLRDTQLLSRLNWTPFFPGSIFGRDGFDDNAKFYSTYIQNQWITYSNRIAFDTASGSYKLSDLVPYTHTGITSQISFDRLSQVLSGGLRIQNGLLEYSLPTSSGSVSSGSGTTGSGVTSGGSSLSGAVSINLVSTASSVEESTTSSSSGSNSVTTPDSSVSNTGSVGSNESTGSSQVNSGTTGSGGEVVTQSGVSNSSETSSGSTNVVISESSTTSSGTVEQTGSGELLVSSSGSSLVGTGSIDSSNTANSSSETSSGTSLITSPTQEEIQAAEKNAVGHILGNTVSESTTSTGTTSSGSSLSGSTNSGTTATLSASGSTSSGALLISSTGSIGLLSLTGGTFANTGMTVTTASGVFQLDSALYDPITKSFSSVRGYLGTGTGKIAVSSGTIQLASDVIVTRDITPSELIGFLEKTLLVSRTLPESVRNGLISYLTTDTNGVATQFLPSQASFQNTRVKSVIAMILMQPEFVVQTGFDLPTTPLNSSNSVLAGTQSKLLFVELGGGYDWMHGVIPKTEYSEYIKKRTNSGGTIVIDSTHVVDIDDFYLNAALAYGSGGSASLKSLYDSGNLRIFNRVGAPNHSRDHDQAQKQIASYLGITNDDADGVFGQLIKYEPSSESTISLSGKKPNVFRNGRFINIGPSGAIFQNGYLNQAERTKQLNSVRTILSGRSYPAATSGLFTSAVRIDEIAQISKNSGGPDGAGYGNVNNLSFLRTLLANNVGKTFFMQGDGGYDTHSNQLAPQSNFDPMNIPKDLNYNIGRVVSNLTTFFNDVKATQDITIVVFSEFGRTNEVNGDLGTDHGQGGGMFVISNNTNLLRNLGQKIYGNMSIKNSEENWLGVGVDYRAVYGKIYNALYGVSDTAHFGVVRDLSKEVSTVPASFSLLRNEYKALNDGSAKIRSRFVMEGDNFDSKQASYIKGFWQQDPNRDNSPMQQIHQWSMSNYYEKPNNEYDIVRDWVNQGRTLTVDVTAFTNQYAETNKQIIATVPKIIRSNQPSTVTGTGNLIFRKFDSTPVSSTGTVLSGSGVILADLPMPYIITSSGSTSTSTGSTGTGTNSTSTGSTASGSTGTGSTGTGSQSGSVEQLVVSSLTLESVDGIRLTMTGGLTNVRSVYSKSGTDIWNGGFILGEKVNPLEFVSKNAVITGTTQKLSEQGIEALVKIGADTLGVGMQLSQPVRVSIPVVNTKPYRLYSSEDGINWILENNGTPFNASGGRVDFMTDHFTYFALSDGTALPPPSCNISASQTNVTNGTTVTLNWQSTNAVSANLSPGIGSVVVNGNTNVVPPNDTGTQYVLSVRNSANVIASCQVIVTAVGITNPPGSGSGSTGSGSTGSGSTGSGSTGTGTTGTGSSGSGTVTPVVETPVSYGAPVPSGGAGGGVVLSVFNQDICPNGDTSGSKFDGRCGQTLVKTTLTGTGTGSDSLTSTGVSTGTKNDGRVTGNGKRIPNIRKNQKTKTPVLIPATNGESVNNSMTENEAKNAAKKVITTLENARNTEISPAPQPSQEKKKKEETISKFNESLAQGYVQSLFAYDSVIRSYDWNASRRLPYAVYTVLDSRMDAVIDSIALQGKNSQQYVSRLESALQDTALKGATVEERRLAEYYLTELFIASRKVSVR